MLTIHLLGRPRLERDGTVLASPRGAKCWALLARLVRSSEPVSRERLVEELFADADDPLGALRWSLAELRRRTGLREAFTGNPVEANLGADTAVDVVAIPAGGMLGVPTPGRFLEGVDPRGSATFESWLLVERQKVETEVLGALRRQALRALTQRSFTAAIDLSGAMVQRDPLDEGSHVLLIKALAGSGDIAAAEEHARSTEALLVRELGVPASPAVRAAVRRAQPVPMPAVSDRTTCQTLREAARATLSAGAAEAGVECLRGAVSAAELLGDDRLLAECLLELGTAFVHNLRGFDDEGMLALESAVQVATRAGVAPIAARAQAELGYVDLLFGRRLSADQRLASAREMAGDNAAVLAAVASFEGVHLHDWGRLDASMARFEESRELALSVGNRRRESWTLGFGARTLYGLGHHEEAVRWADRAVVLTLEEQWTAFRPLAESWRAMASLAGGEDPLTVRGALEGTFAMSCQLRDACWEGISAKAIAMTYVAMGQHDDALAWLGSAASSLRRDSDAYRWASVDATVTEAEIRVEQGSTADAADVARVAVDDAATFDMPLLRRRAEAVLQRTTGSVGARS